VKPQSLDRAIRLHQQLTGDILVIYPVDEPELCPQCHQRRCIFLERPPRRPLCLCCAEPGGDRSVVVDAGGGSLVGLPCEGGTNERQPRKEHMSRRLSIMIFAAVLLLCASFARAQVQQYQLTFTNQSAIIPPTAIMPAASADTPMVVFGTVTSFKQVYLAFTDNYGKVHALPLGLGEYQWGIIVGAGTAPAIESFDPSSAPFDAYIEALALIGPDQQGGMSEPIKREEFISSATSETLLTPAYSGVYLISAEIGGVPDNVTVGWVDTDGSHTQRVVSSIPLSNVAAGNGSPILIHALAGTNITLTTGAGGYWLYVRGIRFSTPAPGPGPFAGVVANLDQASAIGITTVLTVPSSAEYVVAMLQTSMSYTCVGVTGSGSFSARDYVDGSLLTAIYDGALGQFAQSIHLEATTGVRYLTNTYSTTPGCEPPAGATYSLTLAALQF
jgi:hypothetical protein